MLPRTLCHTRTGWVAAVASTVVDEGESCSVEFWVDFDKTPKGNVYCQLGVIPDSFDNLDSGQIFAGWCIYIDHGSWYKTYQPNGTIDIKNQEQFDIARPVSVKVDRNENMIVMSCNGCIAT